MGDASKSLECLCHIMTNVGEKLDTEKAKVCGMGGSLTATNSEAHHFIVI